MLTTDQIRKFSLFSNLDDSELNNIAPCLTKRSFAKGTYLFYPGNPGLNTYLVDSGIVRLFFTNATGQEFLVNLIGPGDLFGLPLLENQLRIMGAAAHSSAVIFSIGRNDLLQFMDRSPQLMRNLYEETNIEARKLLLHTRSLVTVSLDGRLAIMILRLSQKSGVLKDIIHLPLSQTELAGWLGASRGRLNRAMIHLQQMNLIKVEGQKITILDRQGLENLTEGQISEQV